VAGTKFNYVKRGYDPEEVDSYIETLETILKSYKEKDVTIKNAIVSAQAAADNIIKNAELQANDLKAEALAQMDNFANTIAIQKSLIKEFQEDYAYLVQKYVQEYNENEFIKLYDKLNQIDEYFNSLKAPIYKNSLEMGEA
jgi:cell division septum initiation protein DivIVA